MGKPIFNISRMLLLALVMTACSKHVPPAATAHSALGPHLIVYKMKADYSSKVPVMLSADGNAIVSYPGTRDIYYKGDLAIPVQLTDGYYLDRRGIGPEVAFLSLSYEEYRNLDMEPTSETLKGLILERDPILEMYDCGVADKDRDPVIMMNELIASGEIRHQKRLK